MIIWTIESIFIIKLFECTNLASILLQTKSNLRKLINMNIIATLVFALAHIIPRLLLQPKASHLGSCVYVYRNRERAGLQNQSYLLCSSGRLYRESRPSKPKPSSVFICLGEGHWSGFCGASRDENGRERSGKCLNHSRSCIFLSGTETGTGRPDGKTNPVLRDIGNGIFRTETRRLRSGSGNTKRKHRYM